MTKQSPPSCCAMGQYAKAEKSDNLRQHSSTLLWKNVIAALFAIPLIFNEVFQWLPLLHITLVSDL